MRLLRRDCFQQQFALLIICVERNCFTIDFNRFIYRNGFKLINAISTGHVCTTLKSINAIPPLFHDTFVLVSQNYEIYLLRS